MILDLHNHSIKSDDGRAKVETVGMAPVARNDVEYEFTIVGELDHSSALDLGITKESDLSYVVDASANVRQLNRVMNWNLPTDGPKTLNGLIVEQLETIPESGTGVTVADYPIEILDTSEHGIKRVRVRTPGSAPPPKAAA